MENEIDINFKKETWVILLFIGLMVVIGLQLYSTFAAHKLSNPEADCVKEEFLSILNMNPDYIITHYLSTQFFDLNKLEIGQILKMYNVSQPYSDIFLNQAVSYAYDKCVE